MCREQRTSVLPLCDFLYSSLKAAGAPTFKTWQGLYTIKMVVAYLSIGGKNLCLKPWMSWVSFCGSKGGLIQHQEESDCRGNVPRQQGMWGGDQSVFILLRPSDVSLAWSNEPAPLLPWLPYICSSTHQTHTVHSMYCMPDIHQKTHLN